MGGRSGKCLVLGLGMLALSASIAVAGPCFPESRNLGSPLAFPGAPKPYYEEKRLPYLMNYADQAAHSLGMREGRMDLFSSRPVQNSYMPVVSGGLGGNGAMIRLQWRPGQ